MGSGRTLLAAGAGAAAALLACVDILGVQPLPDADLPNPDAADAGPDVVDERPNDSACVSCGTGLQVESITTYEDTLYANVGGDVYVCSDSTCSSLTVLVHADGSTSSFPAIGIAASDAGIAWGDGHGIYFAAHDGGSARQAIFDTDGVGLVVLDGRRVSYVAVQGTSFSVRSCPDIVAGCTFSLLDAGSPTTLVAADAGLMDNALAAIPGQIGWVSQDLYVHFTTTSGSDAGWKSSTTAFLKSASVASVTSNGTSFYWAFGKSGPGGYVSAANAAEAYSGSNVGANPSPTLCFFAGAGAVLFCSQKTLLEYFAADGSNHRVINGPPQQILIAAAATSKSIFMLDNAGALYRLARL